MDPASLGLGVVALLGVTTAAGNLSKAIWLAWRDDDAIVDEVNWMRLQIRQSANTLRTAVEGLQDMVETNPNSKAVRKIKIRRIISDMKDESSFLEQDMERIRQILLKSSSFSIWRKIDWQLSKKNRLFAIAQRFSLFQNGVSLAYLLVQTDILNSLSQQNDQETCKFLQGLNRHLQKSIRVQERTIQTLLREIDSLHETNHSDVTHGQWAERILEVSQEVKRSQEGMRSWESSMDDSRSATSSEFGAFVGGSSNTKESGHSRLRAHKMGFEDSGASTRQLNRDGEVIELAHSSIRPVAAPAVQPIDNILVIPDPDSLPLCGSLRCWGSRHVSESMQVELRVNEQMDVNLMSREVASRTRINITKDLRGPTVVAFKSSGGKVMRLRVLGRANLNHYFDTESSMNRDVVSISWWVCEGLKAGLIAGRLYLDRAESGGG